MSSKGGGRSKAAYALKKAKMEAARRINLGYAQGIAALRRNPLPSDRRLDGSPKPKKPEGT